MQYNFLPSKILFLLHIAVYCYRHTAFVNLNIPQQLPSISLLICSYILSAMFTFINDVQREKDQISRNTQRYIGLKVN